MNRFVLALVVLTACGTQRPIALVDPSPRPSSAPSPLSSSSPPPGGHGFVTRRGHCLERDGARLRVVGSSGLFLQEDAARELGGQTSSRGAMASGFEAAQRAGVRVLRVTAFNDGMHDSAATMQPTLGVYAEQGWRGLDWVIAEAARRDILLVMVLSNYWADYGGLAQWLRWRGHNEDDRGLIFTDAQLIEDLRAYILHVVNRVNTITGVRYGDDPIILAWEIMNEPRGEGLGDRGERHTAWLADMARTIHRAAHQIVTAGEEGFDIDLHDYDMTYWGTMVEARVLGQPRHQSYHLVVRDPDLDVATLHFYPEVWGVRLGDESESGPHWIHEHAAIAAQSNKPLLFEEFGLGDSRRHGPRLPRDYRRAAYELWFQTSHDEPTIAAVMPWGLAYPGEPGRPDGYSWGHRDDDDYSDIVRRWSRVFDQERDLAGCDDPARAVAH